MPIRDIAKNEISPFGFTNGDMIGFVGVDDIDDIFKLKIYDFFLESIRTEDQRGTLFLKRFLEGSQKIWERNQRKIQGIKTLWDITLVDDEYLQYLKNQVGWTRELDHITDEMDRDTLRRLISISVALWKLRGTEDALRDAIFVVTGERLFLYTWEDFRAILGERYLSEEWEGEDFYLTDISDEGDGLDDYYMLLEISDNGKLNRDVVKALASLMRPMNETIQINYMLFYDLFRTDLDNTQWLHATGGDINVLNGQMTLADDSAEEIVYANVDNTNLWADYSCNAIISRATGVADYGILFRYTDEDNTYKVQVSSNGDVSLITIDSGTPTTIVTVKTEGIPLNTTAFFNIGANVVGESIKIYIDGNEIISTTDPNQTAGGIGIYHDSGSKISVKEVKNRPIPVQCDIVP